MRRINGDRGAILTEFAVIGPLLILLALGLLEFGYVFRVHTMQTQAAASGARVLSSAGFDGLADFATLKAVDAGLASLGADTDVERIVIFDPTSIAWTNGTCRTMAIPASGHTGMSSACNVYSGEVLDSLNQAHFTDSSATCPPGKWDSFLCPLLRDADPDGGGTMRIGLYVRIDHGMLTGLFPPGSVELTEELEMCVEAAGSSIDVPAGNGGDSSGSCGGIFG